MPFFCVPFTTCNRQVDSLDRRQCNLQAVPNDVERYARSLEELLLDMNHIKELSKVNSQSYLLIRRFSVIIPAAQTEAIES